MLIFPTYQTLLTRPVVASSDTANFITTDLKLHYDFSNTSCWNRNNSSNAADYTVNNLIDSYNDAFFRVRTSNTFQYGSDSDVINYNTDGGGCLYMDPSEYSVTDETILIVPGSWSGESSSSDEYYNLPTETSSHNLMDGLDDDGPFTFEIWYRVYIPSSTGVTIGRLYDFLTENTSGSQVKLSQQLFTTHPFWLLARKARQDVQYSNWLTDIPGAPATGTGWSDWVHSVLTRDDSNNFKLYMNNTQRGPTITATHNFDSLKVIGIGWVPNAQTSPMRIGIVRFYKGKALTSSEITTNWDAQKERFGH